ncbi:MAG: hypothetical protein IKX34_08060 [Bacteroidales bacterium]|nr:hypothetical protein [Bacteroidales bacterium]
MKQWEDIVKDKLEGYESTLPEGSLAEFRALREGKAAAPARKVAPWIWGLTAVVAAGLAAILFLRKPSVPEEGIRLIQQSAAPVAMVADSTLLAEPMPPTQLITQTAVTPKAVRQISIRTREVIKIDQPVEDAPAIVPTSPFISENNGVKPRTIQVGPAAGVIAGSSLLAAVITPILKAWNPEGNLPTYVHNHADKPDIGLGFPSLDTTGIGLGASLNPTEIGGGFQDEVITGSPKHYFPLKLGLSTRIPVAGQLYVATGLQYSLYSSSYTLSLSGELKQQVHYLGIPVRLDCVFASGRMLDVYVGGGVLGDICVGASLGGYSLPKDGPSLSVLGAGGVQMNVTKHLGMYVEPELSWRIPSEKHVLQTYRSEHPLMFSVAAGLRINLDK